MGIVNYIIHRFLPKEQLSHLAFKRITYALWVDIGMFVFYFSVLIIHSIAHMGRIHYTADVTTPKNRLGLKLTKHKHRTDEKITFHRDTNCKSAA